MTKDEIVAELDSLTDIARCRMNQQGFDPLLYSESVTEWDFLTPEEKDRHHKLKMALPSYAQEAREARERIKARLAKRRGSA